jgi:hypothetical protein
LAACRSSRDKRHQIGSEEPPFLGAPPLDAAVFAAYGWPAGLTDEQILEKLLALNLERAGAVSPPKIE